MKARTPKLAVGEDIEADLSLPVQNFEDAKACDHERYARFFRAMLDRGVWLPPSGYEALFVSSAHDDSALAQAIEAAEAAFGSIAS